MGSCSSFFHLQLWKVIAYPVSCPVQYFHSIFSCMENRLVTERRRLEKVDTRNPRWPCFGRGGGLDVPSNPEDSVILWLRNAEPLLCVQHSNTTVTALEVDWAANLNKPRAYSKLSFLQLGTCRPEGNGLRFGLERGEHWTTDLKELPFGDRTMTRVCP